MLYVIGLPRVEGAEDGGGAVLALQRAGRGEDLNAKTNNNNNNKKKKKNDNNMKKKNNS